MRKFLAVVSLFLFSCQAEKSNLSSKSSQNFCPASGCTQCDAKEETLAKYLSKKPRTYDEKQQKSPKFSVEAEGSVPELFTWPEYPTKESLGRYTIQYAERVGTCLHVSPADQDAGQAEWLKCRRGICSGMGSLIYNSDRSVANLEKNRDQFCEYIKKNMVEKTYSGGACLQYGNCGEGSYVNYCLSHSANIQHIKQCSSSNDHAFTIILKDNKQICVLDRWNIEDGGYYFCHKDIKIKDGVLHHPKGEGLKIAGEALPPSDASWYQDVTCQDFLLNESAKADVSVESWVQEIEGTSTPTP